MIDPYDVYEPYHPDGPDDPDELPGGPIASISWLDDEEPLDDDWHPQPQVEMQASAPAPMRGESLRCGACGQPARSWVYLVGTGEDGSTVIDGVAVCQAHEAAA